MSQPLSQETIPIFDAIAYAPAPLIAAILLKCFLVSFLTLVFVWILILFQGDFFYHVQTFFLDVPRLDFDLFLLYSLTLMKVLIFVFFLFPFIALKLFLITQKSNAS